MAVKLKKTPYNTIFRNTNIMKKSKPSDDDTLRIKKNLHPNKQSSGLHPSNKISRAYMQKKRLFADTSEG